jgi:hypothetical protein
LADAGGRGALRTPVFWWNCEHHGWISAAQLGDRGHLNGPFRSHLHFSDFLAMQSLVISPLLFLALLIALARGFPSIAGKSRLGKRRRFAAALLFLSVFLFYAVLAWHLRSEPNWPAVSYLTPDHLMARWRKCWKAAGRRFIVAVFVFAWLQTLLMHDTQFLHLPQKMDPMGRVAGWSEIAAQPERSARRSNMPMSSSPMPTRRRACFPSICPTRLSSTPCDTRRRRINTISGPAIRRRPRIARLWITGEIPRSALQHDFNTITRRAGGGQLPRQAVSRVHDLPVREFICARTRPAAPYLFNVKISMTYPERFLISARRAASA